MLNCGPDRIGDGSAAPSPTQGSVCVVMYFLNQKSPSDPVISLALEEFCLYRLSEFREILILYVNTPSVIIGRNQNPLEEVDVDYTERMGIPVLRRMSGGGSVFHDTGNLNFCFITPQSRHRTDLYRRLVDPIRSCLRRRGCRQNGTPEMISWSMSGRSPAMLIL